MGGCHGHCDRLDVAALTELGFCRGVDGRAEGVDEVEALALQGADGHGDAVGHHQLLEVAPEHPLQAEADGLSVKADFALIDGNIARGFQIPARAVIGGDAKSPSIAAASILAKVARDRDCITLDAQYPQYGIAKHKGYGTKAHMDALREHGPCEIYRTKFIRFLDKDANN